MASKRRLRRDQCDRKVRHAALQHALIAITETRRRMVVGRRDNLHAYRCQRCGGWHVGHQPNQQQRTRRKDFL